MKRFSMRPAQAKILAQLHNLQPWDQVLIGRRLQEEALVFVGSLARVRGDAVRAMRADGLTWQEVGDLVGVTAWQAMRLARNGAIQEEEPAAETA